ncbi:tetratricopeptide repeat protein [Bacillus sp. 2205SS5-2]|uniref:tetratricopeptide repeat protein n=1 Tax=Bacillus sp. 2205SS5-2 TaxID=3109031 RepID=UPI003005D9F7
MIKTIFHLLLHPRKTLEEELEYDTKTSIVILLSMVTGFMSILMTGIIEGIENDVGSFLLVALVVFSILIVIPGIYLAAGIALLISKIFRGKALYSQMITSITLSLMPIILMSVFVMVIFYPIFGNSLFQSSFSSTHPNLFLTLSVLIQTSEIWSFLLFLIGFCIANQFKLRYFLIPYAGLVVVSAIVLSWFYGGEVLRKNQLSQLVDKGHTQEAINYLDKKLEKNSENVILLHEKGYLLIEEGNPEEGLELINQALDLATHEDVKDVLYNNKAWAHNLLGDFEEAHKAIIHAISIHPNDAAEYLHLGNALVGLDRLPEAISAFEQTLELDATYSHAFYGLGTVYFYLTEYEDAILQFQQYLTFVPKDVDALLFLADAYDLTGQYELEINVLDRVIEMNPLDEYPLIYKGDAYRFMGDYEKAIAIFEEVNLTFSDHPDAHWSLADIYVIQGDKEKALNHIKIMLELDPSYIDSMKNNPNFKSLLTSPEFQQIEKELEKSDSVV